MKKLLGSIALLSLAAGIAIAGTTPAKTSHTATKPLKVVLVCPVTGDKIGSIKQAAGYTDYKGVRYYFCCAGCKPQFDKNPAAYVAKLEKKH